MSADGSAHPVESIIIVRRKSRGDHGHHGGAWKIAYADFVTAMMAFFLVMWLINAANDKTKAQVASYFNPIKLTDTSTTKKGLNEPTKKSETDAEKVKAPASEGKEGSIEGTPKAEAAQKTEEAAKNKEAVQGHFTEEELFKNPYGVLAQLASEAIGGAPSGHSAKGLAIVEIADPGHKGGSAYRDPFDPLSWKALPTPQKTPPPSNDKTATPEQAKPSAPAIKPPELLPKIDLPENSVVKSDANVALAVKERLSQSLKQFNPKEAPVLEVKQTKEGVLVSLTDSLNVDMFSVGSAEPSPQLVILMEKIADTLRTYKGKIVIRGHTDARRFKNRDYDNWRLSTARAQMAYYMLIRAGVDENSVERIEGYADRELKNPQKPEAAENRRIELLLKVDAP